MANHGCDVALVETPLKFFAPEPVNGAGAIVDFFGDVRPLENGRAISGIEYEAHRRMAEHQMLAIAAEAMANFALLRLMLHHRIGWIAAGETSLFLRVTSAHRGEAFRAAEWIIDQLKQRVPIWKRPVFQSEVVNDNCQRAISAV